MVEGFVLSVDVSTLMVVALLVYELICGLLFLQLKSFWLESDGLLIFCKLSAGCMLLIVICFLFLEGESIICLLLNYKALSAIILISDDSKNLNVAYKMMVRYSYTYLFYKDSLYEHSLLDFSKLMFYKMKMFKKGISRRLKYYLKCSINLK
jgi:hypothetical protein